MVISLKYFLDNIDVSRQVVMVTKSSRAKPLCPYCRQGLTKNMEESVEHMKVHKVLRHKMLPGMYEFNIGQLSTVKQIKKICQTQAIIDLPVKGGK